MTKEYSCEHGQRLKPYIEHLKPLSFIDWVEKRLGEYEQFNIQENDVPDGQLKGIKQLFKNVDPETFDVSRIFTEEEIEMMGMTQPEKERAGYDLIIIAKAVRAYADIMGGEGEHHDRFYKSPEELGLKIFGHRSRVHHSILCDNPEAWALRSYVRFASNTGVIGMGYRVDDLFKEVADRLYEEDLKND